MESRQGNGWGPMNFDRRLAAILMADVAGYSRMMSRDENTTVRTLIAHRGVLDLLIVEHRGRIANTAGDSVLAEFASAAEALRCAVAAQQRLAAINASLPEERRLRFRIGVHVGEIVPRGQDMLGDGVNVAARVQSVAPAGGVCISADAYAHVRKLTEFVFEDRGAKKLKNLDDAVRIYAVRAAEEAVRPSSIEPPEEAAAADDGRPAPPLAAGLAAPVLDRMAGLGAGRMPLLAAAVGGVLVIGAAAAAMLTRSPEPSPAPTPAPAAAVLPVQPQPAPVIGRVTLLAATGAGGCQAAVYLPQPRFAETVVEIPGGQPVVEIDGGNLCGLAVSGLSFQRGTGGAIVPSLSSATRIVFVPTDRPPAPPALTTADGGRIELRLK